MTGRRVFVYFMAFFGFIATVNAVMVTLAIRTHSGAVTDHPYEKGLAYNQVVDAQKKQEALGWLGEIELHHSSKKENPFTLYFKLKDSSGTIIKPDNARATFTRPTQSGMDFVIELQDEHTPITFPARGAWHVRVDTMVGDKHYQQSKRLVVE